MKSDQVLMWICSQKMYNFQFLTESIANNIESSKEDGANFCLLLIDIDGFRKINQNHGLN